jgi:hypothetical protein
MFISESLWSLKNSPINILSCSILLFSYIHWRACPKCPWNNCTSIPNTQLADSAHSRSTPSSGRYRAFRPTFFFIIFWRLFGVRYSGTFPRSVNCRHHIILFEVLVHLLFPLEPIG